MTGFPALDKRALGKPEGSVDAICEAALINDVSGNLAIKQNRLARRSRGPGGMTSLGVNDAEGGT